MTEDDALREILAAVQVDVAGRGLARDPERNLFNACPGDLAAACRSIASHPRPVVCVVTGFPILDATPVASETDGPLGAAHLAGVLAALGGECILCTDGLTRPSLDAAGLTPDRVRTFPGPSHPWAVFVELDWQGIVLGHRLTHLLALERVGPSRADGRCYSMRGGDLSDAVGPAHHFFDDAAVRHPGVTTVGVGDGGNEIGMGKVPWATVRRNVPNGERIACRVATNHLVVAGVSNWGAYALGAGLFVLRGVRPPAELFDPARELETLREMVEQGGLVDGVTGRRTPTVDGLDFGAYIGPFNRIADILREFFR